MIALRRVIFVWTGLAFVSLAGVFVYDINRHSDARADMARYNQYHERRVNSLRAAIASDTLTAQKRSEYESELSYELRFHPMKYVPYKFLNSEFLRSRVYGVLAAITVFLFVTGIALCVPKTSKATATEDT